MSDCRCGKDKHTNCKTPIDIESEIAAHLAKKICEEIDRDVMQQFYGEFEREKKLKELFGIR